MPETQLTPIQTLLRFVELYQHQVGRVLTLASLTPLGDDASEQPAGDVDDLYRGAQWWIDLIDSFSQIARSQYVGYAGSEPVNQTIERLIGAIKAQADQVALAVRCGMRGVEVVGVLWDQRDKIDAAVRDLERYSLYPPLPAPGVEPLWDTAEVVERVEAQLEAHRKSQTKRRSPEEEEEARRLGEQLQIKVERHLASFADMGMAVLAKLPTEQQALALKLVADDPPPPADNSGEQPKTKEARRRGPKRKYDSAQDRRISEAWNSGRYITVADLREMTGLKNDALNRYAQAAGVETPGRGKRNFRYSLADVPRILNEIISRSNEAGLVKRCKTALEHLPEIRK